MLEHLSYSECSSRIIPRGFNWIAVLKDLAAGAEYTHLDHCKLQMLSGNWPTCACGQLCANLPRIGDGRSGPKDGTLYSLGCLFHCDIGGKKWRSALQIFYQIEARTAKLLERNASI